MIILVANSLRVSEMKKGRKMIKIIHSLNQKTAETQSSQESNSCVGTSYQGCNHMFEIEGV